MTCAQERTARKTPRQPGPDWLSIAVRSIRYLIREEIYSNLTDPNRWVRIEFEGGRFALTASRYLKPPRTKGKKGAW